MSRFFKVLALAPIWAYRLLVSPFTPPSCRFLPTCSDYAAEAVERHGAWAGMVLTMRRLTRCHPIEKLGAGDGYDPVPLEILPIAWYAPWRVISCDSTMDDQS
ncbi:MAG: membrane protein insertion efficiency factor YidD [Parvibaculales bacterium]